MAKPPSVRFGVRAAYAARPSGFRVDSDRARELTSQGALLVDVRRDDDPSSGLAGAVRVSPDNLPGRVASFPRDVPIVLACS